MQSPDDSNSSDADWLDRHRKALMVFSDTIESCISHAEWEELAVVLESRQTYIQQLFSSLMAEPRRSALKQLAESILQEDMLFQARVEEQKRILVEQQQAAKLGRRAVHAYSQ